MPVTSEDIFGLGTELSKLGNEVATRAAIGRQYYAAYHKCRTWHEALSHPGNSVMRGANAGAHLQLISALQYPDEALPVSVRQRSKFLGAKLDILRIRRHWADYDIQESVKAGEPENQEKVAAAVMQDCDRVF